MLLKAVQKDNEVGILAFLVKEASPPPWQPPCSVHGRWYSFVLVVWTEDFQKPILVAIWNGQGGNLHLTNHKMALADAWVPVKWNNKIKKWTSTSLCKIYCISILRTLSNECLEVHLNISTDKASSWYKTLRAWVLAVVVPHFNSTFHIANECEMQNHCTPNLKKSENIQSSLPPPIHPLSKAGAKAAGTTTTSGQFLVKWNKAISAKVELLPTTEHNNYQKMITAKAKAQKFPPPKKEILGAQAKLCKKIARSLHSCLDWDQKQYIVLGEWKCWLPGLSCRDQVTMWGKD
ncbi:hypothetical protein P691DRAFT_790958 [Macrolepiota fuliginosa MF-IS2]|uniref:Uncharacterized protein n=1 Tax=Macrolepiota fuliginosa MF-IS2 TaxID=1400762 RepID=A0A9P6BVB5_9AGAR|nr:hypothetical protein P691DRAFT_790958 [Macrolepiota fuliginosa MF-IS2]